MAAKLTDAQRKDRTVLRRLKARRKRELDRLEAIKSDPNITQAIVADELAQVSRQGPVGFSAGLRRAIKGVGAPITSLTRDQALAAIQALGEYAIALSEFEQAAGIFLQNKVGLSVSFPK